MQLSGNKKDQPFFKMDKGLNRQIVTQISEQKNEPGWMTDFRLNALAFLNDCQCLHGAQIFLI